MTLADAVLFFLVVVLGIKSILQDGQLRWLREQIIALAKQDVLIVENVREVNKGQQMTVEIVDELVKLIGPKA